ncbi:MAG: beta-N-acetylhexosaminidase [bacterium]
MDSISKNLGQNFIIGMSSPNPSDELLHFIREYNIGGVLFLGKNYSSVETLVDTINKLQTASQIYPLFTSVDHEGGRVQRFKEPFTVLPSYRDVVENRTAKEIFDVYINVACELLSVGINYNLFPVADMIENRDGAIGDRSIGTDLEKVELAISATIRGLLKSGILCCVKHFPGHGCTQEDSHIDLPYSNRTMEELLSYELLPFKKATKAGVHSIMTAHILFKNIDDIPSSLSPKFIQDIIRKEFRFIKLVMTDDISMGAITKHFSPKEASKMALKAGNDLVISSSSDINALANIIDELAIEIDSDLEMKNQVSASHSRIREIKKLIPYKKIFPEQAVNFLNKSELKSIFK